MSLMLGEWFAVLPGASSAAQRTTARFAAVDPGVQVLARHEGKPLIIGRSARPVVTARTAGASVALPGTREYGEQTLAAALSAAPSVGTVAALMRGVGSYHAVLTADRGTWVCGDVAGMT
ncbi:hypothetical protein ACGH2B_26575 [Streptomyces sp. BBFR2]|uniref:hypothetical protein n=1 Tax=Streptomyces sp. BBFR2 TaxID=3372854 RepID=UPI0037D99671